MEHVSGAILARIQCMCIVVMKLKLQLTVVLTLAQTISSKGMVDGFEEQVDIQDHAVA